MTESLLNQCQTFFAHLTLLVQFLLEHIGLGDQRKFRQSLYANMGFLKEGQLRRMINSLAVTIGLHPLSLGIEPEETGKVWVNRSSKIRIRCWIADNVYDVAAVKQKALKTKTGPNRDVVVESAIDRACRQYSVTEETIIPSKVYKLNVSGGPALVLIVEHQNVALAFKWLGLNAMRTIIVMVCSLPAFRSHGRY